MLIIRSFILPDNHQLRKPQFAAGYIHKKPRLLPAGKKRGLIFINYLLLPGTYATSASRPGPVCAPMMGDSEETCSTSRPNCC